MEAGFFDLTAAAESFLLGLASSTPDAPLLLVIPRGTADFRALPPNVTCVRAEELTDQLSGRYAGVVIVPPFGEEVPDGRRLMPGTPIRRWFAEEYLIARTRQYLLPDARIVAFVSMGLLSLAQRKEARGLLLELGLRLVAHLPNEALFTNDHSANTYLVVMQPDLAPVDSIAMLDLVEREELPRPELLLACIAGQATGDQSIVPVRVSVGALKGDRRLDPGFHDLAYLALRAPEGYSEHSLGDIAGIIAGVRVDPTERRSERREGDIPYVQVRHMQSDAIAENDPFWISEATVGPHGPKLARPGDILVSTGGTIGKVVLIGVDSANGVLFDTSVRRVRLTDASMTPAAVAAFLRSELGQLQLRRFTTGTVIPHLTSDDLEQVRIFIPRAVTARPEPTTDVEPPPPPPELSPEQIAARTFEGQLEAVLQQIGGGEHPGWRQTVAGNLRKLADALVPPSLSERVRKQFPAPLAIAYRRFEMAKHNPYEQRDRMINLVDACVYFVFHVLLADYGRADWRGRITIPRPASEAQRPRASSDHRIQFIRTLTDLARAQHLDLFIPQLVDCGIDRYADEFRVQLRNPVAHSAPGSEAFVVRLIQANQERLEKMLGALDFLAGYTMCRVRNHYFQRGQWRYQCEIYKGEEYDLNLDDPTLNATQLINAERDHLVLLSAEAEFLDLWPYYQLHYNDASRESHLCYVKQFTASPERLQGESVRSGMELELTGFEDYFRLPTASNRGG